MSIDFDVDQVALEALASQRDLSDVECVRPGLFRVVRRTRQETLQRLRIRLTHGSFGFEVRIIDEEDRRRWAHGEPRGSAPNSAPAVKMTILGARWSDLDRERRPAVGPEWEF